MGTVREDLFTYTHMIICHTVLLRMSNISEKFAEKIKTHILYSVNFFLIILPFVR